MNTAVLDRDLKRTTSGLYLLDCPFCGEPPKVSETGGKMRIECVAEWCKASAVVESDNECDAVAQWNHRR